MKDLLDLTQTRYRESGHFPRPQKNAERSTGQGNPNCAVVMAGLVPAIHALLTTTTKKDVDAPAQGRA
jgi:hypothetical protein